MKKESGIKSKWEWICIPEEPCVRNRQRNRQNMYLKTSVYTERCQFFYHHCHWYSKAWAASLHSYVMNKSRDAPGAAQ